MKREWTFTVEAVQPYVRTTQRAKFCDPRYRKYRAWKEVVRAKANLAHVPPTLRSDRTYSVHIDVYFKGKRRSDIDNHLKSCLDALWKDDKRVTRVSAEAYERCDNDRMVVHVEEAP